MANYWFTDYVVEGKRETLEHIKSVIDSVEKRYKEEGRDKTELNLSGILIALGLYTEETLKEATSNYSEGFTADDLGVAGDWYNAEIKEINGQTVLTFSEYFKWMCSCNMETISHMEPFAGGITKVYRYSREEFDAFSETTDTEGKYFKAQGPGSNAENSNYEQKESN